MTRCLPRGVLLPEVHQLQILWQTSAPNSEYYHIQTHHIVKPEYQKTIRQKHHQNVIPKSRTLRRCHDRRPPLQLRRRQVRKDSQRQPIFIQLINSSKTQPNQTSTRQSRSVPGQRWSLKHCLWYLGASRQTRSRCFEVSSRRCCRRWCKCYKTVDFEFCGVE